MAGFAWLVKIGLQRGVCAPCVGATDDGRAFGSAYQRHCERSEAIHFAAVPVGEMDCFVASAPRNDAVGVVIQISNSQIHVRITARAQHRVAPPSRGLRAGKLMYDVGKLRRRALAGRHPPDQCEKEEPGNISRQEAIVTESDRNRIVARLWKLPRQLLLALINATAILVIVAAILALVAVARIDHFAENVVATMTEAVLSKVDLPSKDVLANLRNLTAEVRTLRNAVGEFKTGENQALQFEIAQLKDKLTALNIGIERLRDARSILTDEAIGRLGRTATDALMKLRDCSSSIGQMEPHGTYRSKTVEAWGATDPREAGQEN